MITREKALEIANRWLKESNRDGTLDGPYSYDDLCSSRRKPSIYNVTNTRIEDCWYFYFNLYLKEDRYILRSSTILVLSIEDGSKVYFGSANDEG
jgi:hypothetical protein